MLTRLAALVIAILAGVVGPTAIADDRPDALRAEAMATMRKAATFYRDRVALRGGYVYYYSPDLIRRLGEGPAGPTEIWVQPPATPSVGLAYLAAHRATQDKFYLDAARDTARALVYGQLASGGWQNLIEFDPRGKRVGQYRNGQGRGRNYSTLDDGITQTALRCVMRVDQALQFKDSEIHECARTALDALLAAQFANGGFPQVWDAPVASQPVIKAQYPEYDWRTENRIKEYWNLYTLNDGVAGQVVDALVDAVEIYDDRRCRAAVGRLGDFLIVAQMPEPQPAWAQQYDYQMRPVWARKFEPPAIAGRESQDAIATLLKVARFTGNKKYLAPIPQALAYLKKSLLPDGRLARYYELQTNRPLYMTDKYELTHDDSRVPSHYGWKDVPRLDDLAKQLATFDSPQTPESPSEDIAKLIEKAREIIGQLDDQGRWLSHFTGEPLVGQPKFHNGEAYISSEVFGRNIEALSAFVVETAK